MDQDTDDNICRICLKRQDTLFSLFRSRHGTSPYEKLVRKTSLKIELNDAGPSSICSQCLIDLDTTVSFLQKCEQSNLALAARINRSVDEECSDSKNDFEKLEVKELMHTQAVPATVDKNILLSENNINKVQKPSEVILGTHKCPQCNSKRRCEHWTPPTSFTCQYCNKIFNKKYNFRLHLKRHLDERDWPCPTCGALHLTESLAQRHCQPKVLRICPILNCGKKFTNNTNLHIHVRTHSGERPFECHDCEKRFTSKKTLADHVRIHTGEKPYVCSVCGARFTSNHMSAHMSVHGGAGARKHACMRAGCPHRFASAAALRSHARTHAPVRAFACALCTARYKYKQSLNLHVRKRHGVISSQQCGIAPKT